MSLPRLRNAWDTQPDNISRRCFKRLQISSEGGLSLIRYAVRTVTAFSSLPLMIVPILGLVMLIIAMILGTEAVLSKLSGHAISGFATLEITILFSASLIMIGLGVIGQYMARIFDEIKGRPVCLISRFIGLDSSTDSHQ